MFSSSSYWIWTPHRAPDPNTHACFVRDFTADRSGRALLKITGDSQYVAYVNGKFIGGGPARSFSEPWYVDEFDVAPYLRRGVNRLAVAVHYLGVGTFQSTDVGAPGLLAELTLPGGRVIASDSKWRCRSHKGYARLVPRISPQLGWEEQFDAREAPGHVAEWSVPATRDEADDDRWQTARMIRRAGVAPHAKLLPRPVAHLTGRQVLPVRVVDTSLVTTSDWTWSIWLDPLINPADRSASPRRATLLLCTHVWSPRRQSVQCHQPHGTLWSSADIKLNGAPLQFSDRSLQETDTGVAHGTLRRGWNLLLCRPGGMQVASRFVLNVWAKNVRFASSPKGKEACRRGAAVGGWSVVGPVDVIDADRPVGSDLPWRQEILPLHPSHARRDLERIWNAGHVAANDAARLLREVPLACFAPTDVFARCASERVVAPADESVENADAVLAEGAEWTSIRPGRTVRDVRLTLDFGDTVVGRHVLELDAPEGTEINGHCFEFIQADGRVNLSEGMNNTFRLICSGGLQRFHSFVRRGSRYTRLTIRDARGPVRIARVAVETSLQPMPARRGVFQCSDRALTEIWNAGAATVQACREDTYTDCPSYEQVFWVGDGRNEAMVDLLVNGDPRLSEHSWRLAGSSLDRSPLVEGLVPSAWRCILPAWSFLWMRWAADHYWLTGDRAFACDALPLIEKNVDGIRSHLNSRGLFSFIGWNMFDWAAMDTPDDAQAVTHLNCLAVLGLRECATLASLVGDRSKAGQWRAFADGLSATINRHLWNPRSRAYIDCIRANGTPSPVLSQQTQAVACLSGVATGSRLERCRKLMMNPPAGYVRAGSPFFMFFVLEYLGAQGDRSALARAIGQYWGRQIREGATTFWEMFHEEHDTERRATDQPVDATALGGASATRRTRSHCHGWSAAPTAFLTRYVLGLWPARPGFAEVFVDPFAPGIEWARGECPSPRGLIACDWKRVDDVRGRPGGRLILALPKGVIAQVRVPVGFELAEAVGLARSGNASVSDKEDARVKVAGRKIELTFRRDL